ncbi:murein L,D-transpeptidase catalytic domain family protein [Niabella beijingensis]|uniref:murein L,D-transpeptidase catalytic domain family protein n=1 Tax=Niabella beijingensis TaxID=2872700 RepID=UPI001CC17918|nr:murein L,D-transpeptidase catalytic domain family protein [Niabella beijingensis]MBZ4192397.1 murein L,D-transpeptidase catalytic domain family protein [Niabella beijingensis]
MMRLFVKKIAGGLAILLIALTTMSWKAPAAAPAKEETGFFSLYGLSFGWGMDRHMLLYDSLHLDLKGLSEKAFTYALDGLEELKAEGTVQNDSIITIVDFDQPSTSKRMYILDVKNYRVLFNTWAAHGRNSGALMATSFSNRMSSNKSSLGFYLTDAPYYGGNGYSLKLKGMESGINDRAMQRAIVLHGARYVSQASIDELGYLGRSFGCPAVPVELTRPIIDAIKEGSVLFIYNSSYQPSLNYLLDNPLRLPLQINNTIS